MRVARLVLSLALLVGSLIACGSDNDGKESTQKMPARDVIEVMNSHFDSLMATPGVIGVAVGAREDGTSTIQILVLKKTEQLVKAVPTNIEGYPIDFVETDEIRPLDSLH